MENQKGEASKIKPANLVKFKGIFWEARTRIFAWYLLLTSLLVGLSIPIFSRLVFLQVDQRVIEDLREEISTFQEFANADNSPKTISPPQQATDIFEQFLRNNIPADKTFLIATIDGQFYRSSPIGLPQVINRKSEFLAKIAQTTQPIRGQNIVEDQKIGKILYKSEPLIIEGQVVGVLIVANIVGGERQEVFAAVIIVIEVLLVAFMVGLVLTWISAGRVLTPITSLMKTARSISDNDLSQRIPIQGRGDMAELATAFNRMMDRLETSFITQRDFINDAGHELRTPITIIRGHLELLEDDPQERASTIALVLGELDRMTRFVEDLVLLAKAEQPEFLEIGTIDLEQFTEELFAKVQGLVSRNWELEAKADGKISGDQQRITQAIMNLATNAAQHTNLTDTISLGSARQEDKVYFWVKDTGTGIAYVDQQRIFRRFARATNSRRCSEGAGLGLSIVSAIAQSHGGTVELHSQLYKGSTFTLILPFRGDNTI